MVAHNANDSTVDVMLLFLEKTKVIKIKESRPPRAKENKVNE